MANYVELGRVPNKDLQPAVRDEQEDLFNLAKFETCYLEGGLGESCSVHWRKPEGYRGILMAPDMTVLVKYQLKDYTDL